MAFESKIPIDRNIIFYEPFLSEQDVIRNGGVSNDVTYENGVGSFNGSSSFIELYDNEFYNQEKGSVVVIAKIADLTSTNVIIGASNELSFPNRKLFNIGAVSEGIYLQYFVDLELNNVIRGNLTIELNKYYHFVFTSDGSENKMYANGEELSISVLGGSNQGDWFASNVEPSRKVKIGKIIQNTSQYFNGSIDLIEVYNRPLTAEEVSNLYEKNTYRNLSKEGLLFNVVIRNGIISDLLGQAILNTDVEVKRDNTNVLDFNGSSSKLDFNKVYLNGATKLSMAFWFKIKESHNGAFITDALGSAQNYFAMMLSNGKIRFQVELDSVDTNNTWVDGQWHSCVCSYNGTTLKIYIDGEEDGSTTASPTVSTTYDTFIGAMEANTFLNGRAGSFRLYSRGLSANEAMQFHTYTKNSFK